MTPREAAYLAVLSAFRQESFVATELDRWQQNRHPSSLDRAFAYELASGTVRMALALDFLATQLSDRHKLSLKLKERALLRMAIYQACFMDKVPLYAIANESMIIAKKYCHSTFANYLNALLRRLSVTTPSLPSENKENLSTRYSYPPFFVNELMTDYGFDATVDIIKAGNQPPSTFVRLRPLPTPLPLPNYLSIFEEEPTMAILNDSSFLKAITSDPHYYIQNCTPVALVHELAKRTTPPKTILDLCASPGGKILLAHDLFLEAELSANDISQDKIERLSANLKKYGLSASLSCGPGEEYTSSRLFELIILDVPCSNSGVLNKRPEARWRLTSENVKALQDQQMRLLQQATTLMTPTGSLWYLTCSILKSENEILMEKACSQLGLQIIHSKTILPNLKGWDGGFGCLLQKTPNQHKQDL